MDTFNAKERNVKTWKQFVAQAEDVNDVDKAKHPIVKDAYSGSETGKKGTAVLDDRVEKKGEHQTVKDTMPGEKKGAAGIKVLDK